MPRTGRTGKHPWLTRRALFAGIGQVTLVGTSVLALAGLGACATSGPEPWADGTYWADGTGWVA